MNILLFSLTRTTFTIDKNCKYTQYIKNKCDWVYLLRYKLEVLLLSATIYFYYTIVYSEILYLTLYCVVHSYLYLTVVSLLKIKSLYMKHNLFLKYSVLLWIKLSNSVLSSSRSRRCQTPTGDESTAVDDDDNNDIK